VPLGVGFRLKSPGISDFRSYKEAFEIDSTSLLSLSIYQLYIEQYIWEAGPRLNMHLKLFPNNTSLFTMSEVMRLRELLAGWEITLSDTFGPYELLNFTLGSYADGMLNLLCTKGCHPQFYQLNNCSAKTSNVILTEFLQLFLMLVEFEIHEFLNLVFLPYEIVCTVEFKF
jgi:hypothetical protein